MPFEAPAGSTPLQHDQVHSLCQIMLGADGAENTVAQLKAAIENGIPLNGAWLEGDVNMVQIAPGRYGTRLPPSSLLDLAIDVGSEAAVVYFLEEGIPTYLPQEYAFARSLERPGITNRLLKAWPEFAPLPEHIFGGQVCSIDPVTLRQLVDAGLDLNRPFAEQGAKHSSIALTYVSQRVVGVENPSQLISTLLELGASPGVTDGAGVTFLHAAVTFPDKANKGGDSEEMVERFRRIIECAVAGGVTIDQRDASGETALHRAARLGYPNKVITLLNHGADPDALDAKRRTAMKLARTNKHADVCAVLAASAARQAARCAIVGIHQIGK